jgi:inner membrane protein
LDNLTHTLTGLMLVRAGIGKRVPRGALMMMIAANAPDFDVVSWFGGPWTYLEYHRWITHALIAIPAMAFLSVLIARAFAKGHFPWRMALIAASIGVASHVLLDWTNTYGIRLLLPFSKQWLRLDITNIVDLWIWAILLLAVVAPALGRLVSSEIGARPGTGRGWAIAALVLLSGYEFGRYVLHERAVAVLDSRVYDGADPSRVFALPELANPFKWRGIVETSDAYRLFTVNLMSSFDPASGRVVYKPPSSPAVQAAEKNPVIRGYLDFSAVPLVRTIPTVQPPDAVRVEIQDLRFGDPQEPRFVASAVVLPSGKVEDAGFSFGIVRPR